MSCFRRFFILLSQYCSTIQEKHILFTDQMEPQNLIKQLKKLKFDNTSIIPYIYSNLTTQEKQCHSEILNEANLKELLKLIKQNNPTMNIVYFSSQNSLLLRYLVNICQHNNIKIKKLVSEKKLSGTKVNLHLKFIEPEELIGRESLSLDIYSIENMVKNRVIMITGAGGSIGSEIARQISKYKPRLLIFFEITELSLYNLEFDFQTNFPDINFTSILGNVQNKEHVELVIKAYMPNVIFHAAAYKHVPMMEKNSIGAVHNNIKGSWQLANIALKYNVSRFIFISTDKAVNPINVMGASKRVCELICQYLQMKTQKTKFLAVRFGNVLGSSGSVVQRFKYQIKKGGPLTVTHPDIRRYFMSISEACQLVMQAGAIGNGGEIFMLDMDEPIKIITLAEQMITLAGYTPYQDINIKFTGLRSGEKIYEELLTDIEATMATTYPGVRIAKITAAPRDLSQKLKHIFDLPEDSDINVVKAHLKILVPEFQTNLDSS